MQNRETKQDELFRQMAARYIETYGSQLQEDLAELEERDVSYAAPGLDRKVRKRVNALKRGPYLRGLSLIAACLVLVLLIPQFLQMTSMERSGSSVVSMEADGWAAEDTGTAGEAAQEEVPHVEEGLLDTDMQAASELQEEWTVIPLAFALPPSFEVTAVEQDRGQSIYYLENKQLDDVILTLEYPEEPMDFPGLTKLTVNEHPVYVSSGGGYSLLAFEKEEILYTMTCKYDVNTLVSLSGSIL